MVYIRCIKGNYYLLHKINGREKSFGPLGKRKPMMWYPQLINDKAENVLSKIPDGSINLIITDPPYGISFKSPRYQNENFDEIFNDDELCFLTGIGKEFNRILVDSAYCYIFTRWDAYPIMLDFFNDVLNLQTVIVWDKDEGGHGMGDLNVWAPRYELIMAFSKGEKAQPLNGKRPPNVIRHQDIRFTKEPKIHPTQKPRGLMEIIIEKSSKIGDIVCDFYGGSYSVPRAAMRLFRQSLGVELNPQTHRMASNLVNTEFHNDPVFGVDWSKVTNLKIEQPQIV